jgi:predicted ribosome quality control (RQC) complex YloA/Tae2 family protein
MMAAVVALITLLVNAFISYQTWKATARATDEQVQHAKALEAFKQTLTLNAERQKKRLERLSELQRSAELTLSRANTVSELQSTLRIEDGQNNNKMDAFVDTAGDFLRAAAGIFAPPDKGDRNLPSESATTLRDLRKAAVKVTLLLDVNPRGSGSAKDSKAMEDALQRLRECVERFVESVEKEEARPIDQIS